MGSSGNVCGENVILNGYYVSGYKKRDHVAQKQFLKLLISLYFVIFKF